MDCVIPGHAVRSFCASLGCLSRIGSDVYVEFDPVHGLALRAINDAKSAYGCFRYEPCFFERCTAPPLTTPSTTNYTSSNGYGRTSRQDSSNRSRKRSYSQRQQSENSPEGEDDGGVERFECRVAVRALAPVVRSRKNVKSLRITNSDLESSPVLTLAFQFQIQPNGVDEHPDSWLTVIHRIQVAEAHGVTAVASKENASELVAPPRAILSLLDPLKKTDEAALIFRKDSRLVSACSFHPGEASLLSGNEKGNNASHNNSNKNYNALLQANLAGRLKTETAMDCDEFVEFDFRDDRDVDDNDMPENVNQEVILVFSVKEAKAMLQFCSQYSNYTDHQQELVTGMYFFWGGKPLVIDTSIESFSAELVLATLDYKLVSSVRNDDNTAGRSAAANPAPRSRQSNNDDEEEADG